MFQMRVWASLRRAIGPYWSRVNGRFVRFLRAVIHLPAHFATIRAGLRRRVCHDARQCLRGAPNELVERAFFFDRKAPASACPVCRRRRRFGTRNSEGKAAARGQTPNAKGHCPFHKTLCATVWHRRERRARLARGRAGGSRQSLRWNIPVRRFRIHRPRPRIPRPRACHKPAWGRGGGGDKWGTMDGREARNERRPECRDNEWTKPQRGGTTKAVRARRRTCLALPHISQSPSALRQLTPARRV